jgi:demethylmenaquinone methyltransferase/2-methoxy-6-polyprenyl-1,4-benzoquinol methylase
VDDDVRRLVESQKRYYDLRAPDYADETRPADRKAHGNMPSAMAAAVVERLEPRGDVLELACGPGGFTNLLAIHSSSLTAVDASRQMLERNRREVGDPAITYIQADLFSWEPPRRFDMVFFGFWLSHVPPERFDGFWKMVRRCVVTEGRVAFVDEDDRASGVVDDPLVVDGIPAARRTLADGRSFDIVKVFWDPSHLRDRLVNVGWDATVDRVGETFLTGIARDALS